jgi:hypothetical protein
MLRAIMARSIRLSSSSSRPPQLVDIASDMGAERINATSSISGSRMTTFVLVPRMSRHASPPSPRGLLQLPARGLLLLSSLPPVLWARFPQWSSKWPCLQGPWLPQLVFLPQQVNFSDYYYCTQ